MWRPSKHLTSPVQNIQTTDRYFIDLFNAMVIPVMDYSAGVWGFKYYHKCNRVQTRALSYFLGVHNRAPVVGIQGDVG